MAGGAGGGGNASRESFIEEILVRESRRRTTDRNCAYRNSEYFHERLEVRVREVRITLIECEIVIDARYNLRRSRSTGRRDAKGPERRGRRACAP